MNEDRPIEKLLRRYAKKRRADAGAPVKLHPATRRLLQGEVARQFRKDAPGGAPFSFARRLEGWWPRRAWAVPVLGLVAVGLWSLLDRPAPKQLALGQAPNQITSESLAKRERVDVKSAAALASVAETAPADFSAVKAMPPSPASGPVRSLNQPASASADPGVAGKNRRAEQALAYGAAPNQSVASLDGAAEQKGAPARGGFKEVTRADKFGVAPSAAPALLADAASASQKLNDSNARSFDANRVNTLPADPTTGSDATLQPNRRLTGAYAAKASGTVAPLLDTPNTFTNFADSDGLERDQARTYSQSFANLAPEPLKQKAAKVISPAPISPVLANFRVEQTGRQLRVVDGDGSTYLGETDTTPVVWAGSGGGQKEQVVQLFKSDGNLNQLPAAATSVPESQMQNNFYRVAGTNRTLNQTVVFTWSFVAMTNEPIIAQAEKLGVDLNKDARKLPTQFPVSLQNSFINGRAQFGTGEEIKINAVPVSP